MVQAACGKWFPVGAEMRSLWVTPDLFFIQSQSLTLLGDGAGNSSASQRAGKISFVSQRGAEAKIYSPRGGTGNSSVPGSFADTEQKSATPLLKNHHGHKLEFSSMEGRLKNIKKTLPSKPRCMEPI